MPQGRIGPPRIDAARHRNPRRRHEQCRHRHAARIDHAQPPRREAAVGEAKQHARGGVELAVHRRQCRDQNDGVDDACRIGQAARGHYRHEWAGRGASLRPRQHRQHHREAAEIE
ncbi:hypothetical protein WR25_12465 [Diploscapter pachys]|uniref:Uncharacterized protein n=1 Tax=Diploscapter pachys TaxID=2018661 RepID=A0A2A2K744_9BILA|nr:hypothetical protein WR25_12465 [Diploscapter pachys]